MYYRDSPLRGLIEAMRNDYQEDEASGLVSIDTSRVVWRLNDCLRFPDYGLFELRSIIEALEAEANFVLERSQHNLTAFDYQVSLKSSAEHMLRIARQLRRHGCITQDGASENP